MACKIAASLLLITLSSCAPGLLYTDIVRPKCLNMRASPIGERAVRGGTTKLKIPATRVDVSLELNSRAIGDIAKRNGLSTVYYCDERTVSILLGLYRKREIIIYGEGNTVSFDSREKFFPPSNHFPHFEKASCPTSVKSSGSAEVTS